MSNTEALQAADIERMAREAGLVNDYGAREIAHTPMLTRFAALVRAAQPAASGEPALTIEKEPDYWSRGHYHEGSKPWIDPTKVWSLPIGTRLYTAQPAPAPLTDEQIDMITAEQWGKGLGAPYAAYRAYARAIEAAHGITAKEAP
jgi:hypothetical protein